jgi:hypothetical protein
MDCQISRLVEIIQMLLLPVTLVAYYASSALLSRLSLFEAKTQFNYAPIEHPHSGWSSLLSRGIGAVLFELVSGLAVTFGPFHPVRE